MNSLILSRQELLVLTVNHPSKCATYCHRIHQSIHVRELQTVMTSIKPSTQDNCYLPNHLHMCQTVATSTKQIIYTSVTHCHDRHQTIHTRMQQSHTVTTSTQECDTHDIHANYTSVTHSCKIHQAIHAKV